MTARYDGVPRGRIPARRERRHVDVCVVDTEPLAVVVRAFVNTWGRRQSLTSSGQTLQAGQEGAVSFLSSRTAMVNHGHGRPVPESTIFQLLSEKRSKTTELRIADALLTALGKHGLLYGEIEVRPNPIAPRNAPERCWRCT